MKKLRVGIIGTGNISHSHIAGYRALSDKCEVVAACDIDEKKLNAYCDLYGISHRYTDYNEMMRAENLNCVSVCTWNSAHKGATIAAFRGGANVLCEKPMALNAAEALEITQAIRNLQVVTHCAVLYHNFSRGTEGISESPSLCGRSCAGRRWRTRRS